MPEKKDDNFNFDNIEWNIDDKTLEEWGKLPEIDFSTDDISKLWDEANQPMPDLSFSDEDFKNLLEEISFSDSEFNFDWSELDSSEWMKATEVVGVESEPLPEPDPSLTAKDVADWMLEQVKTKGELNQKDAAWHIRRYFGKRFIYLNENHNPAISREVLKEFLRISLKTVVWNRRERYWRLRQPSDPSNRRMVDS